MSANDEQGLWVDADERRYFVQPGKHVRENDIGVALTGIKDDVGEDRHDLLESSGLFEEFSAQPGHFRPKTDAGHGEIALHALRQIAIKALVLGIRQPVTGRDIDWVSSSLSVGKVSGKRLQPDLVSHHPQAAQLRQPAGDCFRESNAVKHNHTLWLAVVQKAGKLHRHIPGRKQVLTKKIQRVRVLDQMMSAQSPAQRGQHQLTQR